MGSITDNLLLLLLTVSIIITLIIIAGLLLLLLNVDSLFFYGSVNLRIAYEPSLCNTS